MNVCTAYIGVIEHTELLFYKLYSFLCFVFCLILSLLVLTLYLAFRLLSKYVNK
jgi:ABC-type polysaccharide/polyol phosphate export permease